MKRKRDFGKNAFSKWLIHYKGMSKEDIRKGFLNNLEYSIAKDRYTLTLYDQFLSLSYTVRERLIERWIASHQRYHYKNAKRVYYFSMEFLLGRLLSDNIMNLGLTEECKEAMNDLDLNIEDIFDQEHDAGLGNGGLGRLAACFLESMATKQLPAVGYGIRYDFGIFNQKIVNGYQQELPEFWLQYRNPWEIERPEYKMTVKFYGKTVYYTDIYGMNRVKWIDTEDIFALPYDIPIPGYCVNTVNTLRLWSARAAEEFNFQYFNSGDYIGACTEKLSSENISKVLYPNDNNISGRELRLKQQYFFSSASLQDIIRRFRSNNPDFGSFPDKAAIQLNDTHPAIAIAELMRLLVDDYFIDWDKAWDIVTQTFAYTNHTLMPEALEKWPVGLMRHLLPRLMEIIFEINARFLRHVSYKFPGDTDRLRRMSIIEEGEEQQVRMAYLAIVGSHSVNGVSKLHTRLLEEGLVRDFYEMWPQKFNNKTNGITQRRWLYKSNKPLRMLINETIGNSWTKHLFDLKKLESYGNDSSFLERWRQAKMEAKEIFIGKIRKWDGIRLNSNTMFDVHIKRIHEYKRQLLKVLHCIYLYNMVKSKSSKIITPRTVLFGGKAAPGYYMAKLIVKFINNVAGVINNDPDMHDCLNVYFLPNYRVTLAEYVIPAADLSEQISTAGTEASGTGNMKFALNGALTVGTMDGANIEISEAVGKENMFIFGLNAQEVEKVRHGGYRPLDVYNNDIELKQVIDLISSGFFSPEEPHLFLPIIDSLLKYGDRYLVLADFRSYVNCQNQLEQLYRDNPLQWTKMSIHNVANTGFFSSDRTIEEYAREIWNATPVPIDLDS
ncbi:MAG: glycogen/starch/alpha-glucan phosphorylase [Chitinispirillaceae bacterium]|nr:glycogen/starch/alpha-glucan phosphorylase [Chitinispirillaceae bacterium]